MLQRLALRHARPQGGRPVVLRVCAETGEVVERKVRRERIERGLRRCIVVCRVGEVKGVLGKREYCLDRSGRWGYKSCHNCCFVSLNRRLMPLHETVSNEQLGFDSSEITFAQWRGALYSITDSGSAVTFGLRTAKWCQEVFMYRAGFSKGNS